MNLFTVIGRLQLLTQVSHPLLLSHAFMTFFITHIATALRRPFERFHTQKSNNTATVIVLRVVWGAKLELLT